MIEYTGKKVIFMLCSNCNINCTHCYISYTGNRNAEETLELTKKLKNKYEIFFNGTEILLDLNYLKCLKEVNQYSIMSNGILLAKKEIRDKLKEYGIRRVGISYHMDIHDQISQIKESFLKNLINILVNENFEVKLMTTITSKNYKNIIKYCEIAKSLGVHTIKFTNFLHLGNGNSLDKELILDNQQLNEFFNLLSNARKLFPKNELYIARCGTFGIDNNHSCNFSCPAINEQITITPDNKVYPCFFMAGVGEPIGELIDDKIYLYTTIEKNKKECLTQQKFANKNGDKYEKVSD